MDGERYNAIRQIMDNPELADDLEQVHPGIKAQMAGYLLNPRLPVGVARKILMAIIAIVGILLPAVSGNKWCYLLLLLLLSFSHRAKGELLRLCGKIRVEKNHD